MAKESKFSGDSFFDVTKRKWRDYSNRFVSNLDLYQSYQFLFKHTSTSNRQAIVS